MIDLTAEHLTLLKTIIAEHLSECEIRLFGSRANGTAKPYSDIDIALKCAEPIDRRTMQRLREALQESALPMRVDLIDWHGISEEFRGVIKKGYEIL